MLLPGSFDADVISPPPPPLAIFIILRYEDGVVEPRRWWCYRYSLYFMKTRKKKEEEKDCIGVSRLLRRISGPFTPLFINEIKVEIKKQGIFTSLQPRDRLSTKGRRRWRFSSIRVAEVGRGGGKDRGGGREFKGSRILSRRRGCLRLTARASQGVRDSVWRC